MLSWLYKLINKNDYPYHFKKAIEFSKNYGLEIPFTSSASSKFIDNSIPPKLNNLLVDLIKDPLNPMKPDLMQVVGNCIGVHLFALEEISNIVGSQAAFTIGAIEIDGKKLFDFTRSDFDKWIQNGIPSSNPIYLHAWITLPSLEIIDLTFVSTFKYAIEEKLDISDVHFIAGHWTKLKYSGWPITYWPIAVGNDIPHKIGLVRFIPYI